MLKIDPGAGAGARSWNVSREQKAGNVCVRTDARAGARAARAAGAGVPAHRGPRASGSPRTGAGPGRGRGRGLLAGPLGKARCLSL